MSALAPAMVALEVQRIFTTLGIAFWDQAGDIPVTAGLRVQAFWNGAPAPPVEAVRNASGVYVFHHLPGMRDVEYPTGDAPAIPSLPSKQNFIIAVEDREGRYMPMLFSVDLPLDYRGVFPSGEAGSLPAVRPKAFVFSSATRPIPAALAAARAQLWDADTSRPASFAVMRLSSGASTYTGIASENGHVLVLFPYPLADRLSLGSPPGSGAGDVSGSTWPVRITIGYAPTRLRFPLAPRLDVAQTWGRIPALRSVLADQPAAPIWLTDAVAAPKAMELNRDLTYRRPLTLTTTVPASSPQRGYLWISRGVSLP